jgi:hypothetical protein
MTEKETLPAHSPLGASSAERWMNCPGSVALIKSLPATDEEEPDYRRDGVQAHALAAACLDHDLNAWEMIGEVDFPDVTAEMASAVQVYLDFVRALPGKHFVETRVHRPEFHPSFFGTLDFAAVSRTEGSLHFVDYKHGAGVYVEVRDNPQLKYYAYGFIGESADYDDAEKVTLTIVQPRCDWSNEGPRSWDTTVGELRAWARDVLKPAMDATAKDLYLDMGEWCRFCPAKLVCPAMAVLADRALKWVVADAPMSKFDPEVLATWYAHLPQLKMMTKAIEGETYRRLSEGTPVPGAKLVYGKTDRVWKADAPVEQKFGDAAWERKIVSPAAAEKLVGGKEFVHEYAFKPTGKPTVAPADDSRPAITIQTSEQAFAGAVKVLDTGAAE